MENENKKELMKVFYKNKTTRNIIIVTLVISIFCISLATIINARNLPKGDIENVADTEEYVSGNIYAIMESFANYSVDDQVTDEYYIALGEDKLYILNLNSIQYQEISTYLSDENNTDGYNISGMSENIPTELLNLAIDTMNEVYETEEMNKDNFYNVFIPYVVNAKRTPNDISEIFYIISFMSGFFFTIFVIVYIISIIKSKMKINKISKVYDLGQISLELSLEDKVEFFKTRMIFLDNYVISYSNALDVIKYTDIAWMYPHTNYVNGVKSANQIYVITKDGKMHIISNCQASGKKSEEEFTNTYNELLSRRPNALAGYTNENILAMSKKNREETINRINEKDNMI